MPDTNHHWPRVIAFVDMNAFFASIEQLDNPEYRGKPIGYTGISEQPVKPPSPGPVHTGRQGN